jgi:hypothetical protein
VTVTAAETVTETVSAMEGGIETAETDHATVTETETETETETDVMVAGGTAGTVTMTTDDQATTEVVGGTIPAKDEADGTTIDMMGDTAMNVVIAETATTGEGASWLSPLLLLQQRSSCLLVALHGPQTMLHCKRYAFVDMG